MNDALLLLVCWGGTLILVAWVVASLLAGGRDE